MFLVAARACTVTVLLTAAAVRAEQARVPIPSTPLGGDVATALWLRCEPTPATTGTADPFDLRVAAPTLYPEPARDPAPQASPARRTVPPVANVPRDLERAPLVMLWESRTSAMFLGIDRRGVGGLHFERKSARERAAARAAHMSLPASWKPPAPLPP